MKKSISFVLSCILCPYFLNADIPVNYFSEIKYDEAIELIKKYSDSSDGASEEIILSANKYVEDYSEIYNSNLKNKMNMEEYLYGFHENSLLAAILLSNPMDENVAESIGRIMIDDNITISTRNQALLYLIKNDKQNILSNNATFLFVTNESEKGPESRFLMDTVLSLDDIRPKYHEYVMTQISLSDDTMKKYYFSKIVKIKMPSSGTEVLVRRIAMEYKKQSQPIIEYMISSDELKKNNKDFLKMVFSDKEFSDYTRAISIDNDANIDNDVLYEFYKELDDEEGKEKVIEKLAGSEHISPSLIDKLIRESKSDDNIEKLKHLKSELIKNKKNL